LGDGIDGSSVEVSGCSPTLLDHGVHEIWCAGLVRAAGRVKDDISRHQAGRPALFGQLPFFLTCAASVVLMAQNRGIGFCE
jgi:hypothetical protein